MSSPNSIPTRHQQITMQQSANNNIPHSCTRSWDHMRISHGIRYRGGMVSDTVPHLGQIRRFCKTEPNCRDPNPPRYRIWVFRSYRIAFRICRIGYQGHSTGPKSNPISPKNQIRYRGGLGSRTVWQIQGSIRYDPICHCIKYPGSGTISDHERLGICATDAM